MKPSGILFVIKHPLKLIRNILQMMAKSELATPRLRVFYHQLRGVKFMDPSSVFIGPDVIFDGGYPPADITIGKNTFITRGTKIIAHQYDTSSREHNMIKGKVTIGNNVFIGFNCVVISAHIKDYSVIGANTVITKNVERYSVVIGRQQKIVKKRVLKKNE